MSHEVALPGLSSFCIIPSAFPVWWLRAALRPYFYFLFSDLCLFVITACGTMSCFQDKPATALHGNRRTQRQRSSSFSVRLSSTGGTRHGAAPK